ncbi:MAG: DUF305 domain-containing protein, partial [Aeromicrobium sp.]
MKPMILLMTALLLVAACAGGTKRSDAQHNDADIAFARDMIAHHEQAVEMAELVDDADASADVTALAEQIAAAQGPEIERMNDWLDDWDAGEMSGSMDGGGHDAMPGMMSPADLEALDRATGAAFDQAWLTMMIAHHEGAVEMAATEAELGENPGATALAENI